MDKQNIYSLLKKITNGTLLLLFCTLALAALDYYFFDGLYRSKLRIIGISALCIFFLGILIALIEGIKKNKP
ncbi:hypothetical protein [Aliikangiella sp. IMCC44359]|uniref:hypothetical protein n=1 Tax=Aliikangiella sp. IMCC44359 TaxID=3459125 RepID=UPI00403A98DB